MSDLYPSTTPVVAQQFGDKATAEHIPILLVDRDIIHHTLQEGDT